MASLNIPVILGTARIGRRSESAAKFVLEQVKAAGHDTELIDVREYPLGATDNTATSDMAKKYGEIIGKADGIIMVVPEYNHGYPGELKMMLDLAYNEYEGKPVGLCGVSVGSSAGARVIEQLRLVVAALGMYSLKRTVMFANAKEWNGEDGEFTGAEKYTKAVNGVIEHVAKYGEALKSAR